MTVVDLKRVKRAKRASRDLIAIDKHSGAGRFFAKLVREIEADMTGRRNLSRIQSELIRAFAGAATALQYLNHEIALGESGELDLAGYATLASTMLRIGSRLGLARHTKPVPSMAEYLEGLQSEQEPSPAAVNESDGVEPRHV